MLKLQNSINGFRPLNKSDFYLKPDSNLKVSLLLTNLSPLSFFISFQPFDSLLPYRHFDRIVLLRETTFVDSIPLPSVLCPVQGLVLIVHGYPSPVLSASAAILFRSYSVIPPSLFSLLCTCTCTGKTGKTSTLILRTTFSDFSSTLAKSLSDCQKIFDSQFF